MKCKFCDGSGKDYWGRNGEPYPCPVCNGTGEYEPFDADIELDKLDSEPKTNEEWFCELSTEEKAKWLENKMTWAAQEQGTFTAKGWAKWLKKPYRKE